MSQKLFNKLVVLSVTVALVWSGLSLCCPYSLCSAEPSCDDKVRKFANNEVKQLTKQLIKHPASPTLYFRRAVWYRELFRYDEELNDLRRTVRLMKPGSIKLYLLDRICENREGILVARVLFCNNLMDAPSPFRNDFSDSAGVSAALGLNQAKLESITRQAGIAVVPDRFFQSNDSEIHEISNTMVTFGAKKLPMEAGSSRDRYQIALNINLTWGPAKNGTVWGKTSAPLEISNSAEFSSAVATLFKECYVQHSKLDPAKLKDIENLIKLYEECVTKKK